MQKIQQIDQSHIYLFQQNRSANFRVCCSGLFHNVFHILLILFTMFSIHFIVRQQSLDTNILGPLQDKDDIQPMWFV